MIQIKEPCHANWQEMTPTESGKYCGACEKVVVDFSKMSDAEIKNYFTEYASQKTCGRFLTSQVDRKLNVDRNYFQTLRTKIPRTSIVQSLVFLAAGSFLWLSSCMKKHSTVGKVQYNDPHSQRELMGDTVVMSEPEDTTALLPQDDTLALHTVGTVSPMVTGKVRMTDTISQRIKKRK